MSSTFIDRESLQDAIRKFRNEHPSDPATLVIGNGWDLGILGEIKSKKLMGLDYIRIGEDNDLTLVVEHA